MKIKNLILTVLTGALALFTSCMPEEPVINTLEGIELGSSYVTIPRGQTSASTTMKINDSWTSSVPEWMTLDPASGAAGDFTLNFIAKADTLSQGEVNITFGGKTQKIVVVRDGDKPKKAGVIFEEPFLGHGQGDFETKDVVGSPWSYDAKYGMKATAYINGANTDAESYLISPEIDLTEETVAILTFEDAVNYMNGNAVEDYLSVEVTTDNGATWEKVDVPTWPAGSGWDFVRSGDVDLSKYLGKKIKFAFHYTSNTAASPTWEIKNVKIANVAGAVPPELKIEPTTVDLSGAGASAEVAVTTDGELVVTGPFTDAECKEADSAPWATIAASAGGYTVTADANPGDARSVYFLFTSSNENGSTPAVLKVNQGANPGAKGAAITNPYTVAEALEICTGKTYSDSDVYVKGIINKIDNINLQYGNAQFWISDDGTTADFEAYRNFWFDGDQYTSQDQLKVGDEVIICGKITLYEKEGQDPIPEFKEKNRIVSLNGGVRYYTVAEALAALKDGSAPVDDKVFVSGIINKIDNVNLEYGNAQYWISDDGTSADFEIYRGLYLGGESFTSADQIAVGDAVTVLGNIKIYKKDGNPDVYEFSEKNYIYFLTHNSTPGPVDEFDYTPGAEYLASTNLWKPVDDANAAKYFYYNCNGADWNGTETEAEEVPFLTKTQSTYELSYANPTYSRWQNQFFIYPKAGSYVSLDENKSYSLSISVTATKDFTGFFKMSRYNPDTSPKHEGDVIWELGEFELKAGTATVIKKEDITGVTCDNIIFVMDFGTNPEGVTVYIKDITLVETGGEAPATPSTIAEIVAAIPADAVNNGTAVEFEANLASPAVVSYVNGKNAYIQDETGAILLYLDNHGLVAGDTIKGKITAKGYRYNGLPELVAIGTDYEKGSGAAPAPKDITLADLLANYDANLLRLVKLSGVYVTDGIEDGDRNGRVSQGSDDIAVYAQIKNGGLVLNASDYGDLVTIPGIFNDNKQVYLWENSWFTKGTPAVTVNIAVDGDYSDWDAVEGVSGDGITTLKAAMDKDCVYFYLETEAGFEAGFHNTRFCLDVDGDESNGDNTWMVGGNYDAMINVTSLKDGDGIWAGTYASVLGGSIALDPSTAEGRSVKDAIGRTEGSVYKYELAVDRSVFETKFPITGNAVKAAVYVLDSSWGKYATAGPVSVDTVK